MPGTLLVVGSAPCLFDDVQRALMLRPFAAIMLVNGACTTIERAEHVLSGHTDKAEAFAAARRKAFPNAPAWQLHATAKEAHIADAHKTFPSVTTWWDKSYCTGATSIAKGAVIGLRGLGFDEVILCGAPMDGSGYASTEACVDHYCHRIGDPEKQKHRVIDGYRRKFKDKFAPLHKGRVFSMSGFTRDCLGEPTR
jgi:hypothetical protein